MAYYGYGYGHQVPETARTVAKAFREAAYCRRSNCYTEDGVYVLESSIIAKGLMPGCEHVNTRRVLEGLEPLGPVKYSFAGWLVDEDDSTAPVCAGHQGGVLGAQ